MINGKTAISLKGKTSNTHINEELIILTYSNCRSRKIEVIIWTTRQMVMVAMIKILLCRQMFPDVTISLLSLNTFSKQRLPLDMVFMEQLNTALLSLYCLFIFSLYTAQSMEVCITVSTISNDQGV